jgi:hypothetical protein
MSLFKTPYIQDYEINNNTIILDVYFMEEKCGYINITNEKINALISCGIRSFKGFMLRENVNINYQNYNIVMLNKENNKMLLEIKCPMEIYEKIKQME